MYPVAKGGIEIRSDGIFGVQTDFKKGGLFPENIEKNGIQRDFNGVVIVYIILYRNAHTPYMKCTDAFSKMHIRF